MKKIILLLLIILLVGFSKTPAKGVETVPNFDFTLDENDIAGSLAKLMRYMKWFNANLDETNVKYLAWGDSIVDNVDATHKLKLKFYIPDGVLKVQKLTLNFSIEKFRAYETGASSGGGSTETSSSQALQFAFGVASEISTPFEGDHYHWVNSPTLDIPAHSHDVVIPAHTHGITYGIYEDTLAAGCMVYVDGNLRLSNGGVGYSTDQANLDLTQWVSTAGWHTIEISSSQLGRINAAYFTQVYVGASGI